MTTHIHKFDVSSSQSTDYRASGQVSGYLLSQWSLSEHEGNLRVVTTDEPAWWGGPEDPVEEHRLGARRERRWPGE